MSVNGGLCVQLEGADHFGCVSDRPELPRFINAGRSDLELRVLDSRYQSESGEVRPLRSVENLWGDIFGSPLQNRFTGKADRLHRDPPSLPDSLAQRSDRLPSIKISVPVFFLFNAAIPTDVAIG
jgi:hypothetical protein